ncbi:MAG TPA: hypothetical protein VKN16_06435 [Methylomirabilota bacterium]|nr:hypothetical protein [Methylomirabilota bacterium]
MPSRIVGDLRRAVDATWARLNAQLQGMESHLERSDAPGEWTTRQVLSHLLSPPGWRPLPVLFAFTTDDPPVIEIQPGRTYVTPERQMMRLHQFVKALDRHRLEVFEYLETLSDEDLLARRARIALFKPLVGTDEVTIPVWVRTLFGVHWDDHAGQLAKIRKAVGLPDATGPHGAD